MSVVSLLGVKILNNPAPFLAPYEFEITFECLEQLQKGRFGIRGTGKCRASLPGMLIYASRFGMEAHLCRICNFVGSLFLFLSFLFADLIDLLSRSEYDQELDSLLVGPIPVGVNKFIFEADPPDLKRIPTSEILGVTVILLSCSYDGREFVRVGYYINNEYDSEELNADPPPKPIIERIRRNLLAEKPRVTRFAIKW